MEVKTKYNLGERVYYKDEYENRCYGYIHAIHIRNLVSTPRIYYYLVAGSNMDREIPQDAILASEDEMLKSL